MAKTNNYFPHDANLRNSTRVIRLRMKLGLEGFGAYCMILERLRSEPDYVGNLDYEMMAFDLHCEQELIRSVIEDFGLFEVDTEDSFHSSDLDSWMEPLDSAKEARSSAANRRWSKTKSDTIASDADAKHMHSTSDADAIRINKRKENKLNKVDEDEEEKGVRGTVPPSSSSPEIKNDFFLADAINALKLDSVWISCVANVSDTDPSLIPPLLDAFADYAHARGKRHADLSDVMSHFGSWIPTKSGRDAIRRIRKHAPGDASQSSAPSRAAPPVKPDEIIRRWGYDPAKVTLSQVMNPAWREQNPPQIPPQNPPDNTPRL